MAIRKGAPTGIEKFLQDFEWNLRQRNVLTEKQYQALTAMAHLSLPRYFTERLETGTPFIHAVEQDYQAMLVDPSRPGSAEARIPLKGKVDRIDLVSATSGDAIVIDFKTGTPKSAAAIRGRAEEGTVSRDSRDGDYFRQLVFYALLLEQVEPALRPRTFVLEFTGNREDGPVARHFSISDAEKDDLRTLIREVWKKITALDFSPLS